MTMSLICYRKLPTIACLPIQGFWPHELRAVPEGRWVILDEIQRLPSLLNEVHRFIEERKLRFVLCGSSASENSNGPA